MGSNIIGIIGGGVSGLAAAYELRRNAIKSNVELQIHIFEKHPVLGGNADTVVVNLGEWQDAEHVSGPYHRWADMGVNDINLTAYKRITRILKEIDYFDKDNPGLHPKLQPLENTETYFTWGSDILLSDDEELEHGVSNPAFSLSRKDKGELKYWIDVVHRAAEYKVVGEPGDELDIDTTVGEYFNYFISHPEEALSRFVEPEKIVNWNDPELKRILTEIRDNIFYPRISAMYFTNDYGPEKMLLAAPMCYYRIQEGRGESNTSEKADRRYFVGGSTRWLKALLDNLLDPDQGRDLVKIHFHRNYAAKVTATAKHIRITDENDKCEHIVDCCVVTVHADDAASLLNFDYSKPSYSETNSSETNSSENNSTGSSLINAIPHGQLREHETALVKLLQSVSYTRSTAVCHTYAGLLPSNRNQWRSYNVLIREGVSLKPYSMTYLCNRHQNDAKGLHAREYNQVGLPQFFVTLNPQREIPEKYVLRLVNVADISNDLKSELPELTSTAENSFHYSRTFDGGPAITHFKHNLLDRRCFLAQRELIDYHSTADKLYFGGGWTNGSGLHEECWQQAELISSLIFRRLFL